MAEPDFLPALRDVLAEALGDPTVQVEDLRALSGGASRQTWSVRARSSAGERPLILQRDLRWEVRPTGGGMGLEADVLRSAAAAGVPVPDLVASSGDSEPLGTPFLLSDHVDGETIARRILRDEEYAEARRALTRQLGRAAAAVHAMSPVAGLDRIDQLAHYRQALDDVGAPIPTFEWAFRWLERNRPATSDTTVVHGDLRLGNVIVDRSGLAAVIDWELAHLGDPIEDLGWLCVNAWRFGGAHPVAGIGEYDDLLDSYAEASGRVVTRDELRWHEVLGSLKWGIMCLGQADRHRSGLQPSVELAAIGRRACENEWDLLTLLAPSNVAPPVTVLPPSPPASGEPFPQVDLHGAPTAAELVEAVRGFLSDELMPNLEGRRQFLTRVAANVLATVGRELAAGDVQRRARADTLSGLGLGGERELADAVRRGDFDECEDELVPVLRSGVADRLAVANPRHLGLAWP